MNFEEIIEIENRLTDIAQQENGLFYDNAYQWLEFLSTPFSPINHDGFFFFVFYSQIQKHLGLAFLSSIRKHQVQSFMCLRQVLEAAAIALYLLSFDVKVFTEEKNKKTDFFRSKKLKDDAYKWLFLNFPEASSQIKRLKDYMNDNFSHSNASNAFQNFKMDGKVGMTFFDEWDEKTVRTNLFFIAEIARVILGSICEVNKKYNKLSFTDNFAITHKDLEILHKKIYLELKRELSVKTYLKSKDSI